MNKIVDNYILYKANLILYLSMLSEFLNVIY